MSQARSAGAVSSPIGSSPIGSSPIGAPDVPAPPFRIGLGPQVAYGAGQIAGQVFRDLPSLLLLFFMTNALGISPALAGVAIFAPKLVWGVICDLGTGVLSDRFAHKVSRRWWLLAGALGAPAALIILFHVPAFSEGGKALYVTCAFSFYMLVFAVFSVPYLAIASDLSSDSHQRTVLMAWRLVFTSVGVLVADSFAPIFVQTQGGGQPAYEKMSLILAVVCPLSLLIAFLGVRRARLVPAVTRAAALSIGAAMGALSERRFAVLLAANFIQLAGQGMGYAAMLYFFTYNLGRQDALTQVGLITLIACAAIIVAQPVWVALARRWGKKPTYLVASAFYACVMAAWGFLGPLGIGFSYLFGALLGLSNSGWALMGFSMMSDVAGEGGGEGKAGLYSSVWIAADKIGFALGGTLLVGLLLSGFGFDAARAYAGLPQPQSALTGVLLAFAIIPGASSLVAGALFARWGQAAPRAAR